MYALRLTRVRKKHVRALARTAYTNAYIISGYIIQLINYSSTSYPVILIGPDGTRESLGHGLGTRPKSRAVRRAALTKSGEYHENTLCVWIGGCGAVLEPSFETAVEWRSWYTYNTE